MPAKGPADLGLACPPGSYARLPNQRRTTMALRKFEMRGSCCRTTAMAAAHAMSLSRTEAPRRRKGGGSTGDEIRDLRNQSRACLRSLACECGRWLAPRGVDRRA